jgi:broad-specificity NMP kinase
MSNKLIICGYPGIGKSSIAGWDHCIDLESSKYSQSTIPLLAEAKYKLLKFSKEIPEGVSL